jgi:hypothetical protein
MVAEAGVSKELWNDGENTDRLSNDNYNHLLVEQYKLYLEMYDRHSARRSLANTFFLTLHAIFISALGLSLRNATSFSQTGLLAFPLIGLLVLCYAWWRMVQYYRRVMTAKEKVIHEMEKRLPANPSFGAEREAMSNDRPYNALRRMELTLPFIFGALYLFTYAYVLYNAYWV